MMKTRNVAQNNASLCQDNASHLGLGGGGGGPEDLGGEAHQEEPQHPLQPAAGMFDSTQNKPVVHSPTFAA